MEIAIWVIVGLAVGAVIGAVATWWISRARGGAVSVMQLKQENDKFKNEVTEHFVETARLINQMTDSYKQVFDHLSSGAEKLVDEKSLAERLPPASGEEVRLSQFGASATAGGTERSSATERSSDPARSGLGSSDRPSGSTSAPKSSESTDSRPSESADPLKSRSARAGSTAGQQAPVSAESGSGKAADSKPGDDSSDASEVNRGHSTGDGAGEKSGDSGLDEKDVSAPDQSADKSRARD